ncbi:MAG: AAA-like domain-containing protein [Deltaproteobacteria bacterium]|jgi:hypothetical protein|nr:AAA-like domain-containing protein [Deltaproteobacteria bacterium]
MLPVLPRIQGVDEMIEGEYYFIIHAPRQSGKTTYLQYLTRRINSEGNMHALNCSLATLKRVTDRDEAMTTMAAQLNRALKISGVVAFKKLAFPDDSLPQSDASVKISNFLNYLSVKLDKDLIVIFDEADSMTEIHLVTFLAQIRDGYIERNVSPESKFPRSILLAGMRDIRDYLTQVRSDETSLGLASPFNVKKEALTLANFTREEIGTLYRRHTMASCQIFESEAVDRAWRWSQGQPWLVNALAYESVVKILKNDYTKAVTADILDQAVEALIKNRHTHIDFLLERLKEPRVIRVMDSVFSGSKSKVSINSDDRQYCIDLGLVVLGEGQNLQPANGIYQEVMSRVLTDPVQYALDDSIVNNKYFDGPLIRISELLKEFQQYWRQNGDSFTKRGKRLDVFKYDEAVHVMMLFAYVLKALNGKAKVYLEYAEGRGYVDIRAIYKDAQYLIEVKMKDNFKKTQALKQIANNSDTSGKNEAWLAVFDRDMNKAWDDKITWETVQINKITIHIVGC